MKLLVAILVVKTVGAVLFLHHPSDAVSDPRSVRWVKLHYLLGKTVVIGLHPGVLV